MLAFRVFRTQSRQDESREEGN